MGRNVLFDFSAGGGSDLEFLIGDLTLEPTAMHEVGDRTVLPMPRTEGVNAGLLTLEDVAISPDGPDPLWAYKLTVRDTISKKAYSTIVGVPAGTGPITFKLLPKFQMPPNPGLGPTVQWFVEDFLAKSETITNAVSQAIAADPRIGQIETKNNAQDISLDLLLATTQAIDAPSGFDANSVTAQAIHMVNSLDEAVNMPGPNSWTLLTYPNADDGAALQQLALQYSTSGPQLVSRVKTSGGWSAWNRLDADKWADRLAAIETKNTSQDTAITAAKTEAIADATTKYGGLPARVDDLEDQKWAKADPIPESTNLNTFTTPGVHRVTGAVAPTLEQWPFNVFAGYLEVIGPEGFASFLTQRATAYAEGSGEAFRTSSDTTGGWNEWEYVVTDKNDYGIKMFRGNPYPIYANSHTLPGSFHLGGPNATASTALPRNEPCDFTHYTNPDNPNWSTQTATYYGTNPEFYWRVSRDTSGTFNEWQRIPLSSDMPHKGNPGVINADTLYVPGIYRISGATSTASTGLPVAAPGVLKISQGDVASWAEQEFTLQGTTPRKWWRISSNTTGGWNAWQEVGAPTLDAGLANALLIDEWWGRVGGAVSTGGKAAVALRFDHGLTKLKSTVLTSLTFRDFKWGMALNSRNWDLAQNSGATKQDVIEWCETYGAEVWNHGATHGDRPNAVGIYDEIVTGLNELRADLPGVPIDGYIPAGVGGTNLDGFNGGNVPDAYSGTYAGQLILANHAIGAGYFSGSGNRLLDGKAKQGQGHYTIDKQTVANIKSRIDLAVADKGGLQLMCHPDYLDNPEHPGNITSDDLVEVLEYLKTKQDAGDLAVLSPYELIRADSSSEGILKLDTDGVPYF